MTVQEERLLETADPSYRSVAPELEDDFVASKMGVRESLFRNALIDPRMITAISGSEDVSKKDLTQLNAAFGLESLRLKLAKNRMIERGISLSDTHWSVGVKYQDIMRLMSVDQVSIDGRYQASVCTAKSPYSGAILSSITPSNLIICQRASGEFCDLNRVDISDLHGGVHVLFMHMVVSSTRVVEDREYEYLEDLISGVLANSTCVSISSLEKLESKGRLN